MVGFVNGRLGGGNFGWVEVSRVDVFTLLPGGGVNSAMARTSARAQIQLHTPSPDRSPSFSIYAGGC